MRRVASPDWQARIRYWRDRLANTPDNPALQRFEIGWQTIPAQSDGTLYSSRARELSAVIADNPLDALFKYVNQVSYPPPELLLTLMDCYEDDYMSGRMSLGAALFGPRKRGVGTHAAQRRRENMYADLTSDIIDGAEHLSQTEVAKTFIKKYQLEIDPETLLRNWRRQKNTLTVRNNVLAGLRNGPVKRTAKRAGARISLPVKSPRKQALDNELTKRLADGKRSGLSQTEAAEDFVNDYKLTIDPETLLRNWRRLKKADN